MFIEEELFPWLERAYPGVREAKERVIVGLSYTGLAAVYVSMMNPSRFTKVIAQSGSFWSNDCWIIEYFEKLDPKLQIWGTSFKTQIVEIAPDGRVHSHGTPATLDGRVPCSRVSMGYLGEIRVYGRRRRLHRYRTRTP